MAVWSGSHRCKLLIPSSGGDKKDETEETKEEPAPTAAAT